MLKEKFENMRAKLENLADSHNLLYMWNPDGKYITLTVMPQATEADQTSFIKETDDGKSSSDAVLCIIFKDGDITISTTGKLFITEALINKFKNIAKKMHYLYLQIMREELLALNGNKEVACDAEAEE